MRIAYINASVEYWGEFEFYINYLKIKEEKEDIYTVEDHEEGLEPRGNYLYKELNYEAAEDGYTSLNMPCWISCRSYEASGIIYVLEEEIENGKKLLKEAILEGIDKHIERYKKLKELIQKGD